jgi:peptidylprolyl isomerase
MRTLTAIVVAFVATHAAAQTAAPVAARTAPVPASDLRTLDPENTLVVETTKGVIVAELTPAAAPAHVARLKELTRAGFYNGLVFHRVIDQFMAQTGDPQGTGEGDSELPDLAAEFTFRRGAETPWVPVAAPAGAEVGFVGVLPVMSQPSDLMAMTATGKVSAWGLYCPGVLGMARGGEPNSANSQFFFMRQPYPSLEKNYTAFGRVVSGLDVVRALKTGEPVVDPDRMTRVRVLADVPAAERPVVRVLDPRGATFRARLDALRRTKGADFSACDVDLTAP